jgi:hypothetical protein
MSRLELYEDLASSLGSDPLGAVFRLAVDKSAEETTPGQ